MDKLYHFYIDEGGLLGNAVVVVTNKKLRTSKKENHISQYYVGKMTKMSISIYLDRFRILFPLCKIDETTKIVIDFKENKKFPREMMVSKDKKHWYQRWVFGKINGNEKGGYMVRHIGDIFMLWRYAKEIE